ncbi:hypothetical protein [Sphingomonas trueperi]|uniref:hypothetical protein n=1 Tax=Sphingomonas trueperi TaxID=53317 RepID=UPI001C7D8A4A
MMNFAAVPLHDVRPSRAAAKSRAADELRHFEVCPMCGQAVDRRDDLAVMYHLPVGHQPLPRH